MRRGKCLRCTEHTAQCLQLAEPVAYVLCYEILFGQAFKPSGPAERVFYKHKVQHDRCVSPLCASVHVEMPFMCLMDAKQRQLTSEMVAEQHHYMSE